MPIFKPETNTPITIALKYKSGKQAINKFTKQPELMLTLTSGDVLYLPEDAAESITALHLGPQEPFILTKLSTANQISWSVERIQQPAKKAPVRAELPPATAAQMTADGALPVPATAPKPIPAQANSINRFYLDRATRLIDVFAAANKYAAEHHSGAVSKDDVRALCISVFIQCTPKVQSTRS